MSKSHDEESEDKNSTNVTPRGGTHIKRNSTNEKLDTLGS